MNRYKPRNKICFQNNENIHVNLKLFKLHKKKWNIFKKKLKFQKKIKIIEKKQKFYKKRLFEKKQFKKYYGCLPEYQLKNILKKLNKKDKKFNIFQNFILLLENRLDIVIRKLRITKTIYKAKQIISHNKVKINGNIINKSNFLLKEGDIISIIK